MHAGVSYLISLANETEGACVSGALFAPGTKSFGGEEEEGASCRTAAASTAAATGCSRPRPGKGGRYSFEITPRLSHRGVQTLPPAGRPRGPGRNGSRADARRTTRTRTVTSTAAASGAAAVPDGGHEPFQPHAQAHALRQSAEFKLQLRNQNGNVIECDCEGSGSQTLAHQLLTRHLLRGRLVAQRQLRQLHARPRVTHDHRRRASPSRAPRPPPARAGDRRQGHARRIGPGQRRDRTLRPRLRLAVLPRSPRVRERRRSRSVPFTPPTVGSGGRRPTTKVREPRARAPSASRTCWSPSSSPLHVRVVGVGVVVATKSLYDHGDTDFSLVKTATASASRPLATTPSVATLYEVPESRPWFRSFQT